MVIGIDEIVYTSKFEHDVKRIKDKSVKDMFGKNIRKIVENPEIGKTLSYALIGERTVRIPSFRLIYAINDNTLILLGFENRSNVYD